MSASVRWLTQKLRDVPAARAAVVRLRTFGRTQGGASNGVLVLFYHRMLARERKRFEDQLRRIRSLGDIIGLGDAVGLLGGGHVPGRFICLTFDDGRRDAYDHAFPILAGQDTPAAFFVVSSWIDEGRAGVMSWADCRSLAAGGMEVGSHSATHRRLADLCGFEMETELRASRARIEAKLGRPCTHFACPWGQPGRDYDPARAPDLARAAGYRSFLTTVPHRAHAGADPWGLPRIRMEPGWGAAELRYAFSR